MEKISVLVVDDSPFIRKLFADILNACPDIEVVGTATDPYDAREKIKLLDPKVVTLDVEMPKMDGISFLEKIMTLRPTRVVMVSTLTYRGASMTIRALELGAIDYVNKPIANTDSNIEEMAAELVEKVRAAAQSPLPLQTRRRMASPERLAYAPAAEEARLIAIGSSTGGVEALRHIFSRMPGNAPPIVITQHMPAVFTATFAARLGELSGIKTGEARDGEALRRGHAYVAPGNRHLLIRKNSDQLYCRLKNGPTVSGHRPSVDVLFTSVAETVGAGAIGVILTGMGRDGAEGLLKMRAAGARTLAQNEASCVVYGMPGSAVRLGAVETEADISDIAQEIVARCALEAGAEKTLCFS